MQVPPPPTPTVSGPLARAYPHSSTAYPTAPGPITYYSVACGVRSVRCECRQSNAGSQCSYFELSHYLLRPLPLASGLHASYDPPALRLSTLAKALRWLPTLITVPATGGTEVAVRLMCSCIVYNTDCW